jgi:protoporphyrinogen oxidase
MARSEVAASLRRMSAGRIVVVGAGPCGLGCARELAASGHVDFEVLEASGHPGGLASSVVDPQGFTWDLGGHVVFSHYGEFDRLLDEVMGEALLRHERSSFVRIADTWVPYPFQNNLHHLPPALAEEAIVGLVAAGTSAPLSHDDFASWMRATFGDGIVRQFMQPYNEKVWAYPADVMSAGWIAERVSVVPWQQALAALAHRRDLPGWGPNNLFAFPAEGGTGEIYRRAAAPLAAHIAYGQPVLRVDATAHLVETADGSHPYESLVWTGPLDLLVRAITDAPADVLAAAEALVHNSVTMVGVGVEAPADDDRSWFYFPEPDVPFYRATNFAKYSPANVPGGRTDRYSSWMTEVASSPWRPPESDDLAGRVVQSLRDVGLVPEDAPVESTHVEHIPYAYPVPTLGRDAALAVIQPWLMANDIYARGRFGAWRYELGNMDHAVKMGVDVARRLVAGTPEEAWS